MRVNITNNFNRLPGNENATRVLAPHVEKAHVHLYAKLTRDTSPSKRGYVLMPNITYLKSVVDIEAAELIWQPVSRRTILAHKHTTSFISSTGWKEGKSTPSAG